MNLGVRLCVRIFLSGCYGVPNVYCFVIQCVVMCVPSVLGLRALAEEVLFKKFTYLINILNKILAQFLSTYYFCTRHK